MFDEDQVVNLKKTPENEVKTDRYLFKNLPVHELIAYRDEITRLLPPLALKDMNMEEEMLLQFHALRSLQTDVLNDTEYPLNQRVTAANSVAAALDKLTQRQEAIYSSERFKQIENLLIRTLNKLPEAAAAAFIDEYDRVLKL